MDLINQLDVATLNFMEQIRAPFLTTFFKIFTYLGEWNMGIFLLLIISFLLIVKKKNKYNFIIWLSAGGGVITAYIFKFAFDRVRPIGGLIQESSSSFPSLHAIVSISFYFLLAYLIAQETKNRILKYSAIIVGVIIVLLLGFSRVYLGVHYLSDVLAGYAMGDVWFLIGVYGLKFINRKKLSA